MKRYAPDEKDIKWFKWQGQAPPETHAHATEEELRTLRAEQLKSHRCQWHQNGAFIVCDVDEFEHGRHIGTSKRLVKTNPDGSPEFAPIGPVMRK